MPIRTFPDGFLWGASTSAHQIEGNNVNSDWWRNEQNPKRGLERSGDACDSYHRYEEDMRLLAEAGLAAYRFSIEWARVEPVPGEISTAVLAHYRRMIDTANEYGLAPVVTLHHFTNPLWFAERGGWLSEDAISRFTAYVEAAAEILSGVEWICTINEPNVISVFLGARRRAEQVSTIQDFLAQAPDPEAAAVLIDAHAAATAILRDRTSAKIGWTVAQQALVPTAGNEHIHTEVRHVWEGQYLDAARGDDFVGVQSYTSQLVDASGIVPHPDDPSNTLNGWAYRPDALGLALRDAHEIIGDVPLLVTENGIATHDDDRRIAYTGAALSHLADAMDDGVPVVGYLHWSALDNYEWGHWDRPFGLIAVEPHTFKRRPKPSLAWLGAIARSNALTDSLARGS